jgi:hypothetical protein
MMKLMRMKWAGHEALCRKVRVYTQLWFEVLTAVTVKMAAFWAVAWCRLAY